MIKLMLIASLFVLMSCGESVDPIKVDNPQARTPYEKNAVDAVGVAEGDQQVSPHGRPAY